MSGTQMQKVIPPRLLVPYLSGKRTVVSGYVYRVQDCVRLTTPEALYWGLDLSFDGSELFAEVPELYVMRWHARDVDTYAVPYGPHMGATGATRRRSRATGSPRRRSTWCRSSTPCRCRSRPGRRSSTSPPRASGASPTTTG
ncbi:hypothetical protein ACFQYP_06840 [Nonomuraea antimicrobica]